MYAKCRINVFFLPLNYINKRSGDQPHHVNRKLHLNDQKHASHLISLLYYNINVLGYMVKVLGYNAKHDFFFLPFFFLRLCPLRGFRRLLLKSTLHKKNSSVPFILETMNRNKTAKVISFQ